MTERKNRPSTGHISIFLLVGLALFFGGAYIAFNLLKDVESGIVYIFILFLPAPMILFGLLAITNAFRQDKSSQSDDANAQASDDKRIESAINKGEIILNSNVTNIKDIEKQLTNGIQQKNETPSWSSVLVYLFIIFGVVLTLVVSLGSAALDISNGVTHSCSRGICNDTSLKDSPIFFYITLAIKTIMVLIIPIILVIFLKKWIDE